MWTASTRSGLQHWEQWHHYEVTNKRPRESRPTCEPPVFLPTLGCIGWTLQSCSVLEQMKLANHTSDTWLSQTHPSGPPYKHYLTISWPAVSVQPSKKTRRWPTEVFCNGEPETLPAPHWKHIFRSEEQREGSERYTTPFLLTCKPTSVQWFTFWKHQQYLQGILHKESEAKIRTKESYFEGIPYIHWLQRKNEYFDSKQWLELLYWKFYRSRLDTFIKVQKWENNLMEI